MLDISLYQKAIMRDRKYSFSVSSVIYNDNANRSFGALHWHNEFEFSIIQKGNAIFRCENREYSVSEGCVIIKNSGQTHTLIRDSGAFEYTTVILDVGYLGFDLRLVHFENVIMGNEKLNEFLKQIAEEYALQTVGFDIRINSLICKCLSIFTEGYFVKLINRIEFDEKLQINQQISKVVNYINSNYQNKIQIWELAELVNMDKFQLMRIFKKKTGRTLIEYLTDIRLQNAIYLLNNKKLNLNVNQISNEIGIDNYRYFCRIFKKKYKVSPLQYRKKTIVYYKSY